MTDMDRLAINTIRFLAADAVEQAQSGHPGMPLGAAPMAYVLWQRWLRHNPRNPDWFDRDRFVLSAGHGSALLYALLHVTGYDLPLEELKRFRQWSSRTPGHPERGETPGVETTTGPLGQGFATGVGMALAERFLGQCFNTPEHRLIDHWTYAIVSDGDLMEGVSAEAASLAGHLRLHKLIYLYDDNHISIEGETDLAFTENVRDRFEAYGWHVERVTDGNDVDAIDRAIEAARGATERPSLIIVRTHIGYGSPKQNTAAAHGEPLGEEALAEAKRTLGWPVEPRFHVPEEARAIFAQALARGGELERDWQARLAAHRQAHPKLAEALRRTMAGELPPGWAEALPVFDPSEKAALSTRDASGKVMNVIAERISTFIGGSADLAPSTKTTLIGYGDMGFDRDCGRNIHFGVREHAMGAAVNGMAVHGGVIPYGATFLTFSDYMRPSIRIAALMRAHSLFIFTHDSVGLGEDGPTHQPVEHLAALRAIPHLTVMRPADANETAAAWRAALERDGPVAFVLSRQSLPVLDPAHYPIREGVPRGAYVLREAEPALDLVLIATGSEVQLALAGADRLAADGVAARVVSMPCWELFEEQPPSYREQVLPAGVPKLALEAGVPLGWRDWVGLDGDVIGLDRFGASAPGDVALDKLGFNVENVVARARALLARQRSGSPAHG